MESFSVLTEFAVAIAGFSGITIAIQARSGAPDPVAEFRNRNLITWSLCAAFGSTLPQLTVHLGARGSEIWMWSSLLYSILLSIVLLVPFRSRRNLSVDERAKLSTMIWIIGIAGTALMIGAQLANAFALTAEPNPAPIYIAVLWMILLGTLQFFRLLFASSSSPAA